MTASATLVVVALLGSFGVVHLLGYGPPTTLMGGVADGGALYPVSCVSCARGVSASVRVLLVWTLTLAVAAGAAVAVWLGRTPGRVPRQDG